MSINLEFSETFLASLNAPSLSTLQALMSPAEKDATGVCGLPCANSCNICVQSDADLTAFYAPTASAETVEVQVMAPAADEEWEEEVRAARTRDEVEEAVRTGMWADTGRISEEEYDAYGCQCLECLNYDDRQDECYDDGDCGLDWNESGYFD